MAPFSEGLAAVKRGDKHGFVDKTGRLVIPFQFDGAAHFQEGRAGVMEKLPKPEVKLDGNGKYVMTANYRCGFIDQAGQLIVPYRFEVCNDFHEGRAFIFVAGQGWGVIDLEGRLVVPPHYTSAAGLLSPRYSCEAGRAPDREGRASRKGLRPSLTRKVLAISIGREIWLSRSSSRQRLCSTMAWQWFGCPLKMDLASLSLRKINLAGVIDRSGRFVVAPTYYDWVKLHPGGLVQVKFGDRLGYLDATGRPLTFSTKEVEDYAAQKLEQLKPPPRPAPGRAVFAKAEDGEYYLRLPDGLCALDPSAPRDRELLDDTLAMSDAELEAAKKQLPRLPAEAWKQLAHKRDWLGTNSGLIAKCDDLEGARSAGHLKAIGSYAVASGMRKGPSDPSGNAGLVYVSALICALADKGGQRTPHAKDNGAARVADAFKRLEFGEKTLLMGLVFDGLACHSAALAPAASGTSTTPHANPKATATFQTLLWLPDWMIMIFARDVIDAAPDAFFQKLEHRKALARSFMDANLKK